MEQGLKKVRTKRPKAREPHFDESVVDWYRNVTHEHAMRERRYRRPIPSSPNPPEVSASTTLKRHEEKRTWRALWSHKKWFGLSRQERRADWKKAWRDFLETKRTGGVDFTEIFKRP